MKRERLGFGTILLQGFLFLFFTAFLAYPLAFTLRRAFGLEGEFTMNHFRFILASPFQREAFLNSAFIATLTVFLSTALVLPLAHVVTAWKFRGRLLLSACLLVPMILPPFVGAIGLKQLLARYGSLNLLLIHFNLMDPAHTIDWLAAGGFWSIILLQVLHLYPVLYLNVSAAMAGVDPSLRESAASLGATGWRQFRTITFPLILPGWFAGAVIVWIWSFTDLGTPLITGFSRVVPIQIFDAVNDLNTNPQGYALVVLTLFLIALLFLATRRLAGASGRTVVPRGTGVALPVAGPLRTGLFWLAGSFLLALALIPHLSVLLVSLSGHWFFTVLPDVWTTANYAEVAAHGLTASAVRNSLVYSGLSSLVDFFLGVGIAWLLARRHLRFGALLDALAMLPLALPGLVLAFGYFAGFEIDERRHPLLDSWLDPRTNPVFLLVISYSVRRLPYIVRSAYAGFLQTSVTLEEASASLGAGPLRTLRRITLPLTAAHLVAGMLLTFSFAMLEVSDSLILAQRDRFYPITKQIWQLMGRIDPRSPGVACALGVLGMILLGAGLAVAGRLLGRRLGQLFRA